MYGRLYVDFAGTREEAREVAKENPLLSLANKSHRGNEGLPMLSATYTGRATKAAIMELLEKLGWDEGSVVDIPYRQAQ